MGEVRRFEDPHCWTKARALTSRVYAVMRQEGFKRDYALVNQIRRAAVSVMSNIAEGFERYGPGEFPHFLSIARGSCGEVRAQLYVAFDAGYLEEHDFEALYADADEVSRTIAGLRASRLRRDAERKV